MLFLACAAACSLPALLAGGAALLAGAFLTRGEGIALAVLAMGALVWRKRLGAEGTPR
jgi:hypothetical protein